MLAVGYTTTQSGVVRPILEYSYLSPGKTWRTVYIPKNQGAKPSFLHPQSAHLSQVYRRRAYALIRRILSDRLLL